MRRRRFALALAELTSLSVLPLGRLAAQNAGRLPKVAFLYPSTQAHLQERGTPLNNVLKGLAELGYVDGQNASFEFRFADHELERLPVLAAELVAAQPDVVWTFTSGGARGAAGATSTVPIVVGPVSEVTMSALVPDFARPPGNITGLTTTSRLLHEKCLQLLKEVAPSSRRVGVLINPLNPVWRDYPKVLNDAARGLGIELVRVEARGAPEVERAFAAMAAQKVDALFGLSDSTLIGADPTPARIFELLAKQRLPSVSDENGFAKEGGLMSLGPDYAVIHRGAAEYIDRILQGAKVADLPVVLPSKFMLAVNLKAAHQLGIAIPPSILLRADEVIE
jgi:putative tryptophan/tyrosine transport system substrate-binding protein